MSEHVLLLPSSSSALGPLAPKLVGGYTTRRFEGLSEEEINDMQYVDLVDYVQVVVLAHVC